MHPKGNSWAPSPSNGSVTGCRPGGSTERNAALVLSPQLSGHATPEEEVKAPTSGHARPHAPFRHTEQAPGPPYHKQRESQTVPTEGAGWPREEPHRAAAASRTDHPGAPLQCDHPPAAAAHLRHPRHRTLPASTPSRQSSVRRRTPQARQGSPPELFPLDSSWSQFPPRPQVRRGSPSPRHTAAPATARTRARIRRQRRPPHPPLTA